MAKTNCPITRDEFRSGAKAIKVMIGDQIPVSTGLPLHTTSRGRPTLTASTLTEDQTSRARRLFRSSSERFVTTAAVQYSCQRRLISGQSCQHATRTSNSRPIWRRVSRSDRSN